MAIVTDISKKAQAALKANGAHFEYGYGDAYHFGGVPGTSSVDIEDAFKLGETEFVVVNGRLLLASEVAARQKEEARLDQVVKQWTDQLTDEEFIGLHMAILLKYANIEQRSWYPKVEGLFNNGVMHDEIKAAVTRVFFERFPGSR